jgi:hypothetical protein
MLAAVAVTSSADDGPGSFRAAVERANVDPSVSAIVFDHRLSAVQLAEGVTYSGPQDLRIEGNVVNILPTAANRGAIDLFTTTGGGDLSLSRISFKSGANGVVVAVPLDATGDVAVSLDRVTIADNALFGLHIVDLTEVPPPPEDPDADPTQIGSNAGISLTVVGSNIVDNGTAAHDRDGIRIDERGAGGIDTSIVLSRLDNNGAEGIELDEAGDGGVRLSASASSFDGNGFVSSGDPEEPDFDDGIDIDEADAGDIRVVLSGISASGNFDEGIDLNEGGDGDLHMQLTGVRANNNTDEGVALEETDEGGIFASLVAVQARGNGADGVQFEEFDGGDIAVDIALSQFEDNGGFGIYASQAQPGSGLIRLRGVRLARNADGPFNTTIEDEETGEEVDSGVEIR